jgi:glucose/arabinose dehydrogenase
LSRRDYARNGGGHAPPGAGLLGNHVAALGLAFVHGELMPERYRSGAIDNARALLVADDVGNAVWRVTPASATAAKGI